MSPSPSPTNEPTWWNPCRKRLDEEEAALQSALRSLRDLRAAILGRGRSALTNVVAEQEKLLEQLRAFAASRQAFLQSVAAQAGASPPGLTLRWLATQAPAPCAAILLQTHERLASLIAQVQQLQLANLALVRHGLDFFHHVLFGATGRSSRSLGYGPTGQLHRPTSRPLLRARG